MITEETLGTETAAKRRKHWMIGDGSLIILSCFVIVATWVSPDAAGAEVYRSDAHRFSLTVPPGWEQVPNNVLQTTLMAIKQQSKEAALVDYESAFQPQGIRPYMSGPRILVQIGKGRVSNKVVNGMVSDRLDETLSKHVANMGGIASSVNGEQVAYDRTRQMIVRCARTSISTEGGTLTQDQISALKLTKYGFVGLHCYTPTAQWSKYGAIFKETIETLSIDPEVALQLTQNHSATSQSDPIQRGVRGAAIGLTFGLIGCAIALLLFLGRTLWKKNR